jgi:hypothetical protein
MTIFACTRCGTAKRRLSFAGLRTGRDGKRRSACKACCNQQAHDQRVADPERSRQYKRDWRAADPEAARQKERDRRAANKESINQKQGGHYAANKESINQKIREYHAANRESFNQKQRDHYAANRDQRADQKSSKYGLVNGDYDILYDLNSAKCEICKVPLAVLCVDHDHVNGSARGLLCKKCNLGLGHFNDSPARLRSAMPIWLDSKLPIGLLNRS